MTLHEKMRANPAINISQNRIYIYQTPNNSDTRGYLKIGQTTRGSEGRVAAQTETAMVKAEILAEFIAVDDNGQPFSDKEIHQFLRRRGIKNLKHDSGKESEWFKISLDDIKQVIHNRQHFIDDFEFLKNKPVEIRLYPSQQAALDKTFARWNALKLAGNDGAVSKKFLWNAKPRFGKTLTAYEFAKKINAKNVLVMTQRTSISSAWFADYHDYIRNSSNYLFGSSKDNKIENDEVVHAEALSDTASAKLAHDPDKQLIYYTTLANIKGKEAGKFKEKNRWIYQAHWDLVILDETHEGTDTYNMDRVLDTLEHDFLLELSGTPFRKMNEAKGYGEKNTFSWSYNEEQEAKENWDYSKGENPYINLPKLNIYTFQVPAEIRVESQNLSEYSFDFNEFFKVHGGAFVHENEVDEFLNILSNQTDRVDDAQTQYYPFADKDTRDQLRHTFWKLPSTDSIRLLAEKLRQHPFFKQYQIIEAAGSRYGQNSMKAEKEVKAAIGDNGFTTKTITLSYDMLTTGTTVKEWTAVLMLDNSKSASKYIQTAFRAQTPWRAVLPNGENFVKTDAYVFDFNPDRVLTVVEEYANIDTQTGVELVGGSVQERERRTQLLLNFLPVIAMSEDGEMRYLNAKDAMDIVNYTNARTVVDEGFMSNNLFNVKALFNMRGEKFDEMRNIVGKIAAVSPLKKTDRKPGELPEDNPDDAFDVAKEKIISRSGLGEKKFGAIAEAVADETDDAALVVEKVKQATGEDITLDDIKKFRESEKELVDLQKKQKTEEDKFRDRLRGFARTIPVLLMAYGTHDMDLQSFDKYISEENFLQVTGISRNDFRFLRSTRDDSGQPIFVEATFNAAIREFLRRKEATAKYYTGENREDIYDYIPSQENNRVFTPKGVVNQMLDILEMENPGIFKSQRTKFLDPYMKSGNFLAEIAKRLYEYSHDKDIERIVEQQLFGITPHEIYTILSQETVYGWAENRFKHRLRNRNFQAEPQIHEAIKQPDGLVNIIKEHFGDMKFDVVIGNPPYQENDNGVRDDGSVNASASPIYQYFVNSAKRISHKQCFVIPSRWTSGAGKGLKKFSETMLADRSIKHFSLFTNSKDVFPDNDIKGGVCYFMRDKDYTGEAKIEIKTQEGETSFLGYLDNSGSGVFIPWKELSDILEKVKKKEDLINSNFQKIVSVLKPYGLSTDFFVSQKKYHLPPVQIERKQETDLEIFGLLKAKRVSRFVSKDYPLPAEDNILHGWKVFLPYAYGCGAIGEEIPSPILGSPIQICTETYLQIGKFKTRNEAEACLKYIKTKFFRAMVGILKTTQHSTTAFRLAPIQNFTSGSDINWTQPIPAIDHQLYKKYGLNEQEIRFIEEKVKEIE